MALAHWQQSVVGGEKEESDLKFEIGNLKSEA
jgi:hypothetical protein